MIDTPPSTKHAMRSAVAFVVSPQPMEPITRGALVFNEDGTTDHLTADVIAAIDFYPATTNHQPKG